MKMLKTEKVVLAEIIQENGIIRIEYNDTDTNIFTLLGYLRIWIRDIEKHLQNEFGKSGK